MTESSEGSHGVQLSAEEFLAEGDWAKSIDLARRYLADRNLKVAPSLSDEDVYAAAQILATGEDYVVTDLDVLRGPTTETQTEFNNLPGVEKLKRLIEQTGGRVYYGDEKARELREAAAAVENPDREVAAVVGPAESILDITDIVSLAESVKAAGPVRFLVSPLWPGDAYGVLGAEKKAGKTWADLDLAVSVALGLKWFGRYEVERSGAVVVYAGEGGARNIVRRVMAIADHKGVPFADLGGVLRVSERVPKLTDPRAMEAMREDLDAHPGTVLVIIDPLYLAAAGAKGSDLYAMGQALSGIQVVCQDAGAALVVTTHWNKTGTGSGADRFTGTGPAEWGRVLGSAAVERRGSMQEGDRGSEVTLKWEFTGSEIPETEFRIVRRVWADDPEDLGSPLHYAVTVTDEGSDYGSDRLSKTQERILGALTDTGPEKGRAVRRIGDALAEDGLGKPLREQTIRDALKALRARGDVDTDDEPGRHYGPGSGPTWWRVAATAG